MKIEYRKPQDKDIPKVVELSNKANEPYKSFSIYEKMEINDITEEDLLKNEQKREYRIIILTNQIIGFAALKKKNNDLIWISQFYIDPKYQRIGYGKKFLELIEKEFSRTFKHIALEYWPDATWAKDFYEKQGYKENKNIFEPKSKYTKVLIKML